MVARVTASAVVALAAALVASGCGNDSDNGTDGEHNDATPSAPNAGHTGEGDTNDDAGSADKPSGALGAANRAFLDAEATDALLDQITPAVDQFFNYDFREFDEHVAQIQTTFTPKFWAEMEPGLQVVREVAVTKEVTSSGEVLGASVHSLEGGNAELLLFVNRTTTEEGEESQSQVSSVILSAAQVGPEWKIDGMKVR